VFNISTKGMATGQTYVYSIMLNDGSSTGEGQTICPLPVLANGD
jgi:hypothetical protein